MRVTFILSVLAIVSSVSAANFRRQDDPSTSSPDAATPSATPADQSSSTAATSSVAASATPVPDPCGDVCTKASGIYGNCHNNANSLACFCTPDSINGLGDCLYCKQNLGTDDSKIEAAALQDNIAGIIQACAASASTSVAPTKVTITASASAIPASQITAPPAAKISGGASTNKTTSATSPASSPSGANASTNGASPVDMSFAGILVGALALFV